MFEKELRADSLMKRLQGASSIADAEQMKEVEHEKV